MSSIAVVVLDTLREDSFSKYFDWLPGRRYTNAWSTSHWTVPAHASLFTGRYPTELGVYAKRTTFDCTHRSVPEILNENGYRTIGFSANPQISGAFQFDRGFDRFVGSWRTKHLNSDMHFDWDSALEEASGSPLRFFPAVWDCMLGDSKTIPSLKQGVQRKLHQNNLKFLTKDDGARAAVDWIREQNLSSRNFLFVNLMEAHAPYNPPQEYQTVDYTTVQEPGTVGHLLNDDPGDIGPVSEAYDNSVHYLSDTFRDMFDVLAERFEHVIVLSDHGEFLGEHGKWGHGYGVEPEVTRIPLHIYSGESSIETVSKPVSIIDLYQTMLDLADGVDEMEYKQRGKSLISDTIDRALLTEYHGLTHSKSVENLIGQGHPHEVVKKYNQTLRGVVLPPDYYGHETMDGFSDYGDPETDNPQEAIADIGDSLEDPSTRDENDLSDGMVSQLSDLGYI